jgi:flagellar biosynthesis protein FlhF
MTRSTKFTSGFGGTTVKTPTPTAQRIEAALAAHGMAASQIRKIVSLAADAPSGDEQTALAGALAALYLFNPLAQNRSGRFMLVGAPGVGKTLAMAKLAMRAKSLGGKIHLVTCDVTKSGGIEQLRHFATRLGLEVEVASGKDALAALGPRTGALVLIDTAGINPYSSADRDALEILVQAAKAEPILVLAAGSDPADAVETAHVFRDIGCQRFLATRLDIVSRLGSMMAVPEALGIAFAEGLSTAVPDRGIAPFSATSLAQLLLARAG